MSLNVSDGWYGSLVYGREVDQEHVQATTPSVRLAGSAFDNYVGCDGMKEWGCDRECRVPLSERGVESGGGMR